jgi:hypothetical protein
MLARTIEARRDKGRAGAFSATPRLRRKPFAAGRRKVAEGKANG